jgi:hypothetical protein
LQEEHAKTEERNKNTSNPWAFPLKLWERCSHLPLFWERCRSSSLRLCLIPFAFVCSKCSKDVVKRRCELCVRRGGTVRDLQMASSSSFASFLFSCHYYNCCWPCPSSCCDPRRARE